MLDSSDIIRLVSSGTKVKEAEEGLQRKKGRISQTKVKEMRT
jgi:hypothetical protein